MTTNNPGNNMTTQRKVRKDFDPTKEYNVDVSGCSEEEKKEVQQGFFDVGIKWQIHREEYNYMGADKYTNTTYYGEVTPYLMFGSATENCNMTAKEFLALVYEPEQQGHVHAELMAQYAEDAKTHDEPWNLWQVALTEDKWNRLGHNPTWNSEMMYRRKPKTHIVNGVEIPDLRIEPKGGNKYYLADPTEPDFNSCYTHMGDTCDEAWVTRRLCYEHTEEGEQAAILHAKAMLGLS